MCDEDFVVPVIKSWYVSNATQNKVNGISSISNGVTYIDDLVFKGKNFWMPITETEWLNFMEALEIDLSESRNLKLDAILNEKTSEPNVNLIRQMKFHCKYGKGNRFIENVLKYHQNGFILTTKQIEAVKNVLC